MSLLQTIHSMDPRWFIFPFCLFIGVFLLEDYAGRKFKKSPEEEERDAQRFEACRREQVRQTQESIARTRRSGV